MDDFHICPGERIWLSSDVLRLALEFRHDGEHFDPRRMIMVFMDALGEKGTLMIPSFSWSFSQNGRYDIRNTKPNTGILSETALQMGEFRRTRHPMHSFLVYGRDQDELCSMNNKHAFGGDSPFAYCRKENVRQIMLGTDYVHALTYVHYVETYCKVPYRFTKVFNGLYTDENGNTSERTYEYAARKMEVGTVERFNRMGQLLEKAGVATKIEQRWGESHVVRLCECDRLIQDDILNNQCRNIYDFDGIAREELFNGFEGNNVQNNS